MMEIRALINDDHTEAALLFPEPHPHTGPYSDGPDCGLLRGWGAVGCPIGRFSLRSAARASVGSWVCVDRRILRFW